MSFVMSRSIVTLVLLASMLTGRPHGEAVAQVSTPAASHESVQTDVPMYRGNAGRTGVMPGPGPMGQPTELWRYQIPGEIQSQPAVVDGVLYVGGEDGGVYALEAATGAEVWRFTADAPVSSSPAVVDGLVYIGSDDGTLYALEAGTGVERWAVPGHPLQRLGGRVTGRCRLHRQ